MFRPVSNKPNFPDLEQNILRFWREENVFRKSVKQRSDGPLYMLYDGPPTVNASPGIHHVLSRVFKDVFPRYKAMRGYYTPRIAGWDTHGLPVELGIEEALGFSSKTEIESYGIGNFNAKCREKVTGNIGLWNDLTERIGFWIDLDHPYITYNNSYIETCWWLIKQLWDKGLVYQGYRVTPHCPRCGTSLSSHEVALGYKDDTPDPSVYIKFKLHRSESKGENLPRLPEDKPVYLLAWTTTPWTLPGNTALAVAPDSEYILLQNENEYLILALARVESVGFEGYHRVDTDQPIFGRDLVGIRYEPLYDPLEYKVPDIRLYRDGEWVWEWGVEDFPPQFPVVAGDFVSMDDGTGIVHIAPAFGEIDFEMGKANNLPLVKPVDLQGKMAGEYSFKGLFVKDADPLILKDLKSRGLLYRKETIKHTYPFCWRCATPLLYYAKPSWYIKTTARKGALLQGNEQINWYPDHIKRGRFGDWLQNNVDWAFSRERYWGTPLPVWKCEACGKVECIGGFEELQSKPGVAGIAGEPDFHRPWVDGITFACQCGNTMRRVPEVIDCWFDSGAMPFAQFHYNFENKTLLTDGRFPADYICEAIDQTRGWFYSLHAISELVFDQPSFKNVICLGHILDAEGEKMSKSKGNVVEPWQVINTYGADALRWYLVTSSPPGNVRRFSAEAILEGLRRFLLTLWNTYSFFVTYANIDKFDPGKSEAPASRPELDRWIISELNHLITEVTKSFDNYDATAAGRKIESFVDDLSNWYIRRSRRRFWKSENDTDKQSAYFTLYECLTTLAKLLAPITPFVAEEIYQNLVSNCYPDAPQSVHLADFPVADASKIDQKLSDETRLVMKVTSLGRSARSKAAIKVRQPLARVVVKVRTKSEEESLNKLRGQILDELNIKEMTATVDESILVDYEIKPNLALLGPKYGKNLGRIRTELGNLDPQEVAAGARAGKEIPVGDFRLLPEEVIVSTKSKQGYAVIEEDGNVVGVTTEISSDLADEGMAREIVHCLQTMRRSAGFDIADYIRTYYQAGENIRRVMTKYSSYIKQETLSGELTEAFSPGGAYLEQHQFDGCDVTLAVKRQ
ncbi:MAG: isoleucine--tRNA ligase [Dehalococcoidia bacterium]|nr:isoleucine--tRNA ligase [Dehalococcoidia bacterium]